MVCIVCGIDVMLNDSQYCSVECKTQFNLNNMFKRVVVYNIDMVKLKNKWTTTRIETATLEEINKIVLPELGNRNTPSRFKHLLENYKTKSRDSL